MVQWKLFTWSVHDTPWSSLTILLSAESDADVDGESGGGVSSTAAWGFAGEISDDDEIFLLFASELTSGLALLLLFWAELVTAVEFASGWNEAILDGRVTAGGKYV